MGIEYIGMKPVLATREGKVSTCSNHWTSSLIAQGLMRAKTARQAIQLMGAMVEKYGFTYYWAPEAGCAIPVIDGREAWIMEIFGPGADWTPDSGEPGAVWCAQRLPDEHVSCSANRSRIGKLELTDSNFFMASPNVFSLAEGLKLWERGTPFKWCEVYGTTGGTENSMREWASLNSLAPSLQLEATGDPARDRYAFSVQPDKQVAVDDLMAVMRDCYEGTEFDVTNDPVFQHQGNKSVLARPVGSPDLFELLGVKPPRCIASETSGYVYISQIRDWLPAPVSGCMWSTLGPSFTSCFVPVYSGTRDVRDAWSRRPNFTKIDLSQAQWRFQLVEDLVGLKYQEAIDDVRRVFEPAEKQFLTLQPKFERAAAEVFHRYGAETAQRFVTQYSNACLKSVDETYGELVDYLTFKYLYSYADVASPVLPTVAQPQIPALPRD